MADEEQLDPVEQVFLHAYPNPNRINCPGDDVVRAIAQRKLSLTHPAREHLARCSPCYRDFKRFQKELQNRESLFKAVAAIAALFLIGTSGWYLLQRQSRGSSPSLAITQPRPVQPAQPNGPAEPMVTAAVLNLEGLSRNRGLDTRSTEPELQRLPRKSNVSLSIYLPLGSEDGLYEIRLLQTAEQLSKPAATYRGTARVQDGLTVLLITADFSGLTPNTYVLAFRRGTGSWQFCRVLVT